MALKLHVPPPLPEVGDLVELTRTRRVECKHRSHIIRPGTRARVIDAIESPLLTAYRVRFVDGPMPGRELVLCDDEVRVVPPPATPGRRHAAGRRPAG